MKKDMVALTIKNYSKKVLIVGPIYDKIEILSSQQEMWSQHELIIFNGNLCYPSDNLEDVEKRIEAIDPFLQSGRAIYNLGNQDITLLKKLEENQQKPKIVAWLKNKNNVVLIDFLMQSTIIITNGGVTPEMKRSDLQDNLETSFISNIKGLPWHHWYGGGYGYIISNNPLTQGAPKFYNFSMQLGNIQNDKSKTYAAQIGPYGINRIFSL